MASENGPRVAGYALGGPPGGAAEAPLAVAGEADPGVVELHAIPELAGDLLVVLVERLAVVGELAAAHEVAVAQPDLAEPVGIGQRLARGGDEVGLALGQDRLGLLEGADATARHHRRGVTGGADGARESPRPAARCGRTGRARRRSPWACTRSRTVRCRDRPPRRPWADARPRSGRPWTRTGSRRRPPRTARRTTPRPRAGCRPRSRRRRESGRRRRSRRPTRCRTAPRTSSGRRTRCSRAPP